MTAGKRSLREESREESLSDREMILRQNASFNFPRGRVVKEQKTQSAVRNFA